MVKSYCWHLCLLYSLFREVSHDPTHRTMRWILFAACVPAAHLRASHARRPSAVRRKFDEFLSGLPAPAAPES